MATIPDFDAAERRVIESAYDQRADVIVTPCRLCHAKVEIQRADTNKRKAARSSTSR